MYSLLAKFILTDMLIIPTLFTHAKTSFKSIINFLSMSYNKGLEILKTWALIVTSVIFLSIVSSVFYLIFYYIVMPTSYQESSITFSKSYTYQQTYDYEYQQNFRRSTDHNSESLNGRIDDRIQLGSEDYKITAKFLLPEENINFEIGNFEVSMNIYFVSNNHINIKSMGMLKYYSPAIRLLRSIFKFPFILLDLAEESQEVIVEYSKTFKNPEEISNIDLIIKPSTLRIYSGSVKFEVRLNSFRNFMHRHYIISFFIGSFIIFLILSSVFLILLSLQYESLPNQPIDNNEKDELLEQVTNKLDPITRNPEQVDFSEIIKPLQVKPRSLFSFFN